MAVREQDPKQVSSTHDVEEAIVRSNQIEAAVAAYMGGKITKAEYVQSIAKMPLTDLMLLSAGPHLKDALEDAVERGI